MRLIALVCTSLALATTAQAQEAPMLAFCDMLFECGREPDAAACAAAAQDSDERARAVGDEVCTQYADAELEWMACMGEVENCDTIDVACPAQDAVRDDLEEQGASACGNGQEPLPPPNEWQCDAGYFNAADGCDCGCGSADFDCGDVGCTGPGCNDGGCQWCHGDNGEDIACGGGPIGGTEGEGEGERVGGTEGEGEGERGPGDGAVDAGGGNCANTAAAPALIGGALLLLRRRRRHG